LRKSRVQIPVLRDTCTIFTFLFSSNTRLQTLLCTDTLTLLLRLTLFNGFVVTLTSLSSAPWSCDEPLPFGHDYFICTYVIFVFTTIFRKILWKGNRLSLLWPWLYNDLDTDILSRRRSNVISYAYIVLWM